MNSELDKQRRIDFADFEDRARTKELRIEKPSNLAANDNSSVSGMGRVTRKRDMQAILITWVMLPNQSKRAEDVTLTDVMLTANKFC